MKILFLHGWQSIVGGVKPTYLKEHGHDVLNPALDHDDFDLAIRTAQAEYDLHRPDVIVGSSRGGAVAMNMRSYDTPLVLLCPAWKRWGTATTVKQNTTILHSPFDDVISYEDSQELEARSGLLERGLIATGDDHRLADEDTLSLLLEICQGLAANEPSATLGEKSPAAAESMSNLKRTMQEEASYVCDACGEQIVIPLDLTAGNIQQYVEDCPVCCRANVIHIEVDDDGDAQVWAEPEQDYR
jgi:hypothetical protein